MSDQTQQLREGFEQEFRRIWAGYGRLFCEASLDIKSDGHYVEPSTNRIWRLVQAMVADLPSQPDPSTLRASTADPSTSGCPSDGAFWIDAPRGDLGFMLIAGHPLAHFRKRVQVGDDWGELSYYDGWHLHIGPDCWDEDQIAKFVAHGCRIQYAPPTPERETNGDATQVDVPKAKSEVEAAVEEAVKPLRDALERCLEDYHQIRAIGRTLEMYDVAWGRSTGDYFAKRISEAEKHARAALTKEVEG